MQQEFYYVVRATDRLRMKLEEKPDRTIGSVNDQPTIWLRREADFSKWTVSERISVVKLLFLGYLEELFGRDDEFVDFFDSEFAVSIDLFDKYWTIDRCSIEDDLDQIGTNLQYETVQKFTRTGIARVDGWIEDLVAQKKNET